MSGIDNEKQFESDIESFLISEEGGWTKATDTEIALLCPLISIH